MSWTPSVEPKPRQNWRALGLLQSLTGKREGPSRRTNSWSSTIVWQVWARMLTHPCSASCRLVNNDYPVRSTSPERSQPPRKIAPPPGQRGGCNISRSISMSFHVGQKVVRVGSAKVNATRQFLEQRGLTFSYPELGEVCTIVSIDHWLNVTLLRFREHDNSHLTSLYPKEPGFNSRYFRPLVEAKSSISFTEGAPKDSERFDNRRKVGVDA